MNVLFVGAHPDDIEIFAAGAVLNHLERGDDVYCVVYFYDGKEREFEFQAAMQCLGVDLDNCGFLKAPSDDGGNHLPTTYDMVARLDALVTNVMPRVVYTHYAGDYHPYHRMVSEAMHSVARTLHFDLLCWSPSNTGGALVRPFQPNFYHPLTREQFAKKMEAIHCHASQTGRYGQVWLDRISQTMQYWGLFCHSLFAEPFEVARAMFNKPDNERVSLTYRKEG